jgi:hypothetical protein
MHRPMKTMLPILCLGIGVLLVLAPAPAAADDPSVFEPRQMGSAAVLTFVESCQRTAEKSGMERVTAWHHCACLADRARQEHLARGERWVDRAAEILGRHVDRCARRASAQPPNSFGTGAAPSVFARKELGSASVSAAQLGCMARTEDSSQSISWRIQMCSCVTDWMRVLYKRMGQGKFLQATLTQMQSGEDWSALAVKAGTCKSYADRTSR